MSNIEKIMLQQQFNFTAHTDADYTHQHLAIQAGTDWVAYCIYNRDDNRLLQLKRYSLTHSTADSIETIVNSNEALQSSFQKIITGLDFGFSTFLPAHMSHADATPLMHLENVNPQQHTIREGIGDTDIVNIYAVPADILTKIVHHFPSSSYLHLHSAAIKTAANTYEKGLLRVDVQPHRFSAIVYSGPQLLLAKNFQYTSATDMVFYLLKVSEILGFTQEEVSLQLSGLIDTSSQLYKSLYDYFLNVALMPASWDDTITGLPTHYFTTLNELILCESLQEV